MKTPIRILLVVLCAALVIAMPFAIYSPVQNSAGEEGGDEEEIDFSRLFISAAYAEEEEVLLDAESDGELHIESGWELPLDFTVPPMPNPAGFTEDGYADQSIRVRVETRKIDKLVVDIAWIEIADASQLRTAVAYNKPKNKQEMTFTKLARNNNAIVAMNGDKYTELEDAKTFEYRMTEKIRSKANRYRDLLIIDDKGDFHFLLRSEGLKELPGRLKAEGRQLVNGFCFGPALVMDGELIDQSTNDDYKYNPKGLEPRSAIGQIGPLSYVMVLVEGRSGESTGTTFQGLANIMFDLGCQQAYNLDGGNSAELALMGPADAEGKLTVARHFEGGAGGRSQKDIIYFATAVPESEWQGE